MPRHGQPDPPERLETGRLILRPLDRTDTHPYARMLADRRVWTFIPPVYWRAGPRNRIRTWRSRIRAGQAYHFVIRTRDDNKFVGEIALHHLDWENKNGEIGYHLVRQHWGKGFATESAQRICDWAFRELRLHRLEAETTEGNRASDGVLKKLGFHLEGRRPEQVWIGGKWRASLEYGLLKAHFRGRLDQLRQSVIPF